MIINDKATYLSSNGEVVDYSHEIRLTDPYRHKYDSAMAEYLDYCAEDDEETGSTEWAEYVQRFGKWLLFTDDRGFVTAEKHPTVDAAKDRFAEIDHDYCEWAAFTVDWS